MAFRVAAAAFFLCSSFSIVLSKIYDRCELAQELRDVHEIPEHQLATWVCITNYESHFNTSAHNPGSGDHGLFQISELFWCSPPGVGYACGLPCSALKDEDIEDDVICAKRIYRQHQRLSGDGFTAWVVYNQFCRNPVHVASFLDGCFYEEKYGYQPVYEAMNLPTIKVPMPSPTPTPQPTPPPVATKTTPKPKTSTTRKYVTLTGRTSPISVTTPRPTVKPKFPTPPLSGQSPKPSTIKPLLPKFPTVPRLSVKPTTPKPSTIKPLPPNLPTVPIFRVNPTTPKPFTIQPLPPKFSTSSPLKPSLPQQMKKVSTVFPTRPNTISSTSSKFQASPKSNRISPYKPSPISSYKPLPSTTPRPPNKSSFHQSFSYTPETKPTPHQRSRFSSTSSFSYKPTFQQTLRPSPFPTSTKPPSTLSTYKPFLRPFTTSSKPRPPTTKKPVGFSTVNQRFSSTFVTPKPPVVVNDFESNKAAVVKSREIKPFSLKRDEKVYAYVNNPGYSFVITSHGFKFFRTEDS